MSTDVFLQYIPVNPLPAGGAEPRGRPEGWEEGEGREEEGLQLLWMGDERPGERPGLQHGPIKFPPMTSSHSSPEERTMAALTFQRVGTSEPRPRVESSVCPRTPASSAEHQRSHITDSTAGTEQGKGQRSPLCLHALQ